MKNKRTCNLVDFAVPTDHRVKMKENEEIESQLYRQQTPVKIPPTKKIMK